MAQQTYPDSKHELFTFGTCAGGGEMVRPAQSTVIGTGILIQTARLIVDLYHRYPANVRELSRRNPRRLCVREPTPRPSSFIHTEFTLPFLSVLLVRSVGYTRTRELFMLVGSFQ